MCVLNWQMPERIAEKRWNAYVYSIGGEYVIDIDSYSTTSDAYRNTEKRTYDARSHQILNCKMDSCAG